MNAIIYEDPSLSTCITSVRNLKESGITFTEIDVIHNKSIKRPYKLPMIEFFKDGELIERHYGVIDIYKIRHIINVYK